MIVKILKEEFPVSVNYYVFLYPTNCVFYLGIIQNLSTFEHFRRRSGYVLPREYMKI